MKKIPTLFKREFKDHKVVGILPEFTNDACADALYRGIPTVKFDGSCCAVINGKFYKRYDAKKGKPVPEDAIKCQEEADPVTGHLPCWVPVDENNPADKWFVAAYKDVCREDEYLPDGTYEAIGPHFQGNPYSIYEDTLIPHGMLIAEDFKLSSSNDFIIDDISDICRYLELHEIEGIVFWLDGAPVCKIKRTDFGLEWPVKKNITISMMDEVCKVIGPIPKEVLESEELEEAYKHYMKMNFGNESRPEFLTKRMNIPVEEEK
jgi:hypothetical protein